MGHAQRYKNHEEDLKNRFDKFRNSELRKTFWPVRSHELSKFLSMSLLMFSILLSQNLVRSIKDSFIVTMVGPEVISYIKLWGEMPMGILFVIIYTKMCNVMTTERAFRYIICFFMIVDIVFAYIIFPNQNLYHPNPEVVSSLILEYPHAKWFLVMWGKWSFVVMYILGELWPVIVFNLLFWQLANKITSTEEAGRFYPTFSIFGQINCLIAGSIIVYFSSDHHFLTPLFKGVTDQTEILLKCLTAMVVIIGLILIATHLYIEKTIVYNSATTKRENVSKEILKLSFIQSLKFLLKSKYFGYITIILISYSIAMNLMEGLWMAKVKDLYPDTNDFIAYHGKVLYWTGVFTIICAFFGGAAIRKFGWLWGAILTPLLTLLAGTVFFSSVILENQLNNVDLLGIVIHSPLLLIAVTGGILNIVAKGLKYSLCDSTKEMAYIPLSSEEKTKGKAIADVVGAKIGKSAGAFLQFATFTIFPQTTYNDISTMLMTIFIIVCVIWTFGVIALSKEYNLKIQNK